MFVRFALLAPHEEAGFGTTRRERIKRGLVGAFIKEFRQRLFLGPSNIHGFAIDDLSDVGRLIVHVANQDRLRRADYDAGRFQSHIDAVRAKVTFLS